MRDDNWLSEAPLDEWHGVNSDYRGRVFQLHLVSNGLSGEIPPELGNFSNLKHLILRGNQLSGKIPPELGNLSNLETLDLNGNQLNGKIPPELGNFSNLKLLILSGNQLSGKIPPELGNLSNLEVLNLAHNQLSGLVPSELGNLRNISLLDLTGNRQLTTHISQDVLTSPPPTWIFTEDIPGEHQTALRDKMESVRAYFSEQFGVEATGFTVIVGTSATLLPVYRDIAKKEPEDWYLSSQFGARRGNFGWVTRSPTGGAVVALMHGIASDLNLAESDYVIVHEYFHVLQGQLATGFAQLEDGEIAWHTDISARGPQWLVEGTAQYADHAYSRSRIELRPYLGREGRYAPYKDLANFRARERLDRLDFTTVYSYQELGCIFDHESVYALGFAGTAFLLEQAAEDSYVKYWKLLWERPTWQQAFEEAFSIDINDFYSAFDEWLPSQLPPAEIELKIPLRWPNFEPLTSSYLNFDADWIGDITAEGHIFTEGDFGHRSTIVGEADFVSVVYTEGTVGTAYLSLWYTPDDICTDHLLGWYKDGELTSSREDATPFRFTGRAGITVWNLPGHPDTLPRLEQRTPLLLHCQ